MILHSKCHKILYPSFGDLTPGPPPGLCPWTSPKPLSWPWGKRRDVRQLDFDTRPVNFSLAQGPGKGKSGTENGWSLKNGRYVSAVCLALLASWTVLELITCGCKAGCRGRCGCLNIRLPCTPLCKCYDGYCENTIREVIADNDIDDEKIKQNCLFQKCYRETDNTRNL